MLKKTVAFVLAAILIMMTCGAGSADNERTSGLYTYEFKGNGTVVITGFDWKHNLDNIYIPALIDGYPVTGIGERAFALPDDSAAKGNYVVTLSGGITTIGDFAFQNAPVSTINIPDSTTFIGIGAFLVTPNYIHINVAPTHGTFATIDGVLFNKAKRELLAFPSRRLDDGIVSITVVQGSYAEQYAIENGIQFKYAESEDNLSWLYGGSEASETKESTDWLNP